MPNLGLLLNRSRIEKLEQLVAKHEQVGAKQLKAIQELSDRNASLFNKLNDAAGTIMEINAWSVALNGKEFAELHTILHRYIDTFDKKE